MTVGELKAKLAEYVDSDKVIIGINTGDCGIPGRLDYVGYDATEQTVYLVHICEETKVPTRLDTFIEQAFEGTL